MKQIKIMTLLMLNGLFACGGSGDGTSESTATPLLGLSERPKNSACQVSFGNGSTDIQLTPLFSQLTFSLPILFLPHPSEADIYYVVQQRGLVYRVDLGSETRTELVNLAAHYALSNCGECGLLGMAFHPDFDQNGSIYFSFTEDVDNSMVSYVARFQSNDNGMSLQLDQNQPLREDVFQVVQTFSNHNGGHIAFGPDGFLYIGLGDGGSGNDPLDDAQDPNSYLGAMLRVTDDGEPAPDNNVAGALPEIFAYGLRNPWRFSFDRQTGELWAGDVGQSAREEVNIIVNGGNYGWRCLEGSLQSGNACSSSGPYVGPVTEYDHSEGNSITGGYVYRGQNIPALQGQYLFADFGSGTVWRLEDTGNGYARNVLISSGENVSSFAESPGGELFIVAYGGQIYRIDPANDAQAQVTPENLLSATGCVAMSDPSQPAQGLIPYAVTEGFWSDGASKYRSFSLPEDSVIQVAEDGDFLFPVGTVLVKTFTLAERVVETRLLMQESVDNWSGYSYQWNQAQTEATLLDGSVVFEDEILSWYYPSRTECAFCHTEAANSSLGLEARQLNNSVLYPESGINANQLDTLESIGVFSAPLSQDVKALTMIPSIDTQSTVDERARSYLHSNCAHCHRPGGTTQSDMDLRLNQPFNETNTCDQQPQNGDLGIDDARIIAPGEAARSVLWQRMQQTDDNRMPPVAGLVVDAQALALLEEWINTLASCD